jgi:hypothetical protein
LRFTAKSCNQTSLIVWGKNDDIFLAEGAYPDKRDLQTLEFHLLNRKLTPMPDFKPSIVLAPANNKVLTSENFLKLNNYRTHHYE